jgi:hypothetical protein
MLGHRLNAAAVTIITPMSIKSINRDNKVLSSPTATLLIDVITTSASRRPE